MPIGLLLKKNDWRYGYEPSALGNQLSAMSIEKNHFQIFKFPHFQILNPIKRLHGSTIKQIQSLKKTILLFNKSTSQIILYFCYKSRLQ